MFRQDKDGDVWVCYGDATWQLAGGALVYELAQVEKRWGPTRLVGESSAELAEVAAVGGRLAEELEAARGEIARLTALVGDDNGQHVIEFRADGWTIMHPLACRPDLFACPVNRVAGVGLTEPPAALGRYEVSLNDAGDQLLIGDRVGPPPERDQRPHSRACGIHRHDHGADCHANCPTRHGGVQ
jgi:hypothetical protein